MASTLNRPRSRVSKGHLFRRGIFRVAGDWDSLLSWSRYRVAVGLDAVSRAFTTAISRSDGGGTGLVQGADERPAILISVGLSAVAARDCAGAILAALCIEQDYRRPWSQVRVGHAGFILDGLRPYFCRAGGLPAI